MSDPLVDGVPGLERLGSVVQRRAAPEKVWRHFLVAQAQVQINRRREMTTQRILLMSEHELYQQR